MRRLIIAAVLTMTAGLPLAHATNLTDHVATRRAARLQHHSRTIILHVVSAENATDIHVIRDALTTLVNNERIKRRLPPLTQDARLNTAAQNHAEDMRQQGYYDHASLDGRLYDKRISDAGYPGVTIETCDCEHLQIRWGENIARGFTTANGVFWGWMRSPEHRSNILSTQYDHIGHGVSGTLWVQDFGGMTIEGRKEH